MFETIVKWVVLTYITLLCCIGILFLSGIGLLILTRIIAPIFGG